MKLKELRESKYLSQRELADITGLTATTINRIETGKQTAMPRTKRKISKALEVTPDTIDW